MVPGTVIPPVTQAWTPEGRCVVLEASQWGYICFGHEEMEEHLDAIEATIASPDHREDDEIVGRERLFRRGVGPERWMRVVVEFRGDHDWVVNAFPQENDPAGN